MPRKGASVGVNSTAKCTSATSSRGSSATSSTAVAAKGKSATSRGTTSKPSSNSGQSKSSASRGTINGFTAAKSVRESKPSASHLTTSTSNSRQGKPSASHVTTSTSNSRQGTSQQPKRNDSSKKPEYHPSLTDDFLRAFSEMRLTDTLPGGTRKPSSTEKTSYSVAKKQAPAEPGIYKIYRKQNDKEAYIGHTKNLKKRLMNHAYGTQHVDEFLREEERNAEVKINLSPTKDEARSLEVKELNAFKEQHGYLPEFNHRI